jgi:two-component system LytT family response regulator
MMGRRIRAILVDDEAPARARLGSLLGAHPDVEIVAEAGDVESAAAICLRDEPDVVFLDIQLPRASGFDLLAHLSGATRVIFVTAYDDYAVRAFEVNALDYLLKPIHPERLAGALQRLRALPGSPTARLELDDQIALREDRGLRLVPVAAISHIEADDNYSQVFVAGAPTAFVRRSMAEWEKLLPENAFLRISRSLLIRLAAVRSVQAESRELTLVTLEGFDLPLRLGRRAGLLLRRELG